MINTIKIFLLLVAIVFNQVVVAQARKLAAVEDRSMNLDAPTNRSYISTPNDTSSNTSVTTNARSDDSYGFKPRTYAQNNSGFGNKTPSASVNSNVKLINTPNNQQPMMEETPSNNREIKALEQEIESNDEFNNQKLQDKLQEIQAMPFASRLQRLENITEEQKKLKYEKRIRLLQLQLQELTGLLESQQNKLDKMVAQDKLLHEELERKLAQLGSKNLANSSSSQSPGSDAGLGNTTELKNNSLDAKKSYSYKDAESDQQSLYNSAYEHIKARKYEQAINAFKQYNAKYPDGKFSESSNYWLGEIYMLQSQYDKALAAFNTVLVKHPKGQKAADAMYKKGLVYLYQKDFIQAKKILSEVVKKYNNTTSASLAEKQLKNIEAINVNAT